MKTIAILWTAALFAVIGVYVYMIASMEQHLLETEAARTSELKVGTYNPQPALAPQFDVRNYTIKN